MSIVTDQTYTSDSIQNQLNAAQNCIGTFGCPTPYYPQLIGYEGASRQLHVEAVQQGYIVEAYWGSKKVKRVAVDAKGLAEILRDWAAQYECKAK
jgi:hypothetical protein